MRPDDTLREVIEDALDRFPGILAGYLFGSHARGNPHRESDIDLGILLDWSFYTTPRERFNASLDIAGKIMARLERSDLDLVVLNDAPPLLARHVLTRGERLCCFDTDAEHAFRRDTLLRAADLAPFLERHRRILLDTLGRR